MDKRDMSLFFFLISKISFFLKKKHSIHSKQISIVTMQIQQTKTINCFFISSEKSYKFVNLRISTNKVKITIIL